MFRRIRHPTRHHIHSEKRCGVEPSRARGTWRGDITSMIQQVNEAKSVIQKANETKLRNLQFSEDMLVSQIKRFLISSCKENKDTRQLPFHVIRFEHSSNPIRSMRIETVKLAYMKACEEVFNDIAYKRITDPDGAIEFLRVYSVILGEFVQEDDKASKTLLKALSEIYAKWF